MRCGRAGFTTAAELWCRTVSGTRILRPPLVTAPGLACAAGTAATTFTRSIPAYLDALHRTPELVRGFLEKILAPKQEHTINVPQRNRKRGQDMEL